MVDYKIYNNELKHFGILGQKWGIRRYQNPDGSLTSDGKKHYSKGLVEKVRNYNNNRKEKLANNRKTRLLETERAKKLKVEKARKEAADRIKFYGGKNVALNEIQAERKYNTGRMIRRRSAVGTVAAGIGTVMAGIATGSSFVMSAAIGGLPVAAITAASIYKGRDYLNMHANEQIAYTKDSDVGHDIVVKKSKGE